MAGGVRGIGLLSTIVAIPAVIGLEVSAAATGLLSLVGKYVVRNSTTKAEKHQKIRTIASTE